MTPGCTGVVKDSLRSCDRLSIRVMPSFRPIAESKSGDAIKCRWRHGTPKRRFPPATLIRLYELLKNDSRSFDRTGQALLNASPVRELSVGGGERDRTDDPLLAKQVLSQLSYTPRKIVVGLVGFEPTTPALSRRCSNRLSYRPSRGSHHRVRIDSMNAPAAARAGRPRLEYCRQRQPISVGERN